MITDDTKLIEIDTEADILEALIILGGSALLQGNRRLYDHILRAKLQHEQGVNLHLTDNIGMNRGPQRQPT